ncbi:ThiF family adenylyltransferase [Lentzea albidocapillata]|uniref:ThiF family protein n=1 Tax=Lentzea albidocapillata TaxID=40571 RepID=A0A1W2FV04_9PSEU|nr:ThiF family adenylyltransferase [Lentzea albidocapillata]SMD25562.1 ThiF family protein [Lentzea albidocapillata]
MSQRLISRDPALKRLRDEGYDVSIINGYLVVGQVPYVTPEREVAYGALACAIGATGDDVLPPTDHTMRFVGKQPCMSNGARYEKIINQEVNEAVAPGLVATYSFSCKPPSGQYADYHEKVTTYIAILGTEAHVLDPTATAQAFLPVTSDGTDGSVFHYIDTASSRAGINATNDKLRGQRIAIVGLGGTGSHILDLVAKTWVEQIHLYDDDLLQQHNAFRTPGALSEQDLKSASTKVAFLAATYSRLRTGVVPHEYRVDEHNVHELVGMDFVFLALTDGAAKKIIVDALEQYDVAFIDCGMGLYKVGDALAGQVRVTTSTPDQREDARQRISFVDGEQDEYSENIQTAELNSLNADMAVIKWKKLNGFYLDLDHEHNTVYVLDGNMMINEDKDGDADHDQS